MYKFRYALCYAGVYATLHLIDALLNFQILSSGITNDLSPFGTAGNVMTLILEPLNVMILCLCTSMLFMMESNPRRVADMLQSGWGALLGTPYALLALKLLSVLNSSFVSAGFVSPVSYFYIFRRDEVLSLIFFCTMVAIALYVPVTDYLRKRYPIA